MKIIYINTYNGAYHPCEIESFRYNPITKMYILYYLDRTMNEYYYAHLKKENNKYFIVDYDFKGEELLGERILNLAIEKCDISELPPYISFKGNSELLSEKLITYDSLKDKVRKQKKLDYLEITCYEDTDNGLIHYYFIIDEINPSFEGFTYKARLVIKSKNKLKKNIIARHKINSSIDKFLIDNKTYYFSFGLEEELSKSDFNEYQEFLNKYYNSLIDESVEKQL